MIGHFRFAFNAADAGCSAALGGPDESFLRREEFVPVVDGADVGIAGVGPAFAGGVGDHYFGFLADVVVGFAEGDCVSVGLRHFAAVEAGNAGGFGEEDVRFGEDPVDLK